MTSKSETAPPLESAGTAWKRVRSCRPGGGVSQHPVGARARAFFARPRGRKVHHEGHEEGHKGHDGTGGGASGSVFSSAEMESRRTPHCSCLSLNAAGTRGAVVPFVTFFVSFVMNQRSPMRPACSDCQRPDRLKPSPARSRKVWGGGGARAVGPEPECGPLLSRYGDRDVFSASPPVLRATGSRKPTGAGFW